MSDLSQLLLWWLLFSAIVFFAARFGGLLGIFGGHLVVTILVDVVDQHLIQSEVREPGFDGSIEALGLFQIVLLNAVLVPASSIGCLVRLLRKIPP